MSRLSLLCLLFYTALTMAAQPVAWNSSFDKESALPKGWTSQGTVSIATKDAFKGSGALVLSRTAPDRQKDCSVLTASFAVTPGSWEFSCATAVDLESPDMSFKGAVNIETLDSTGKVIDRTVLAEPFGKRPWQLTRKRLMVSEEVKSVRFDIHLEKTIGTFRVDELAAKPILDTRKPSAINRIVFSSAQLGNLFKPEDKKVFTVTVESMRELSDAERVLTWSVHDYWGAEQAPATTLTVNADGKNKNRFKYQGTLDLAKLPVETGRYYEIHAQVPLSGDVPFSNFSSFAILPIAASKAYKPAQIPFNSRSWDNRVTEYLRLADRVGVRMIGLWGSSGMDVCKQLGAGVVTGCGANLHAVERMEGDWEKWTDSVTICNAVKEYFAVHGGYEPKPLAVTFGNEPNNSGEHLKKVIRSYKIAYDQIKKVAPQTIVLPTSIGASEEYFKNGYQDACDAFDFHAYESPRDVRRALDAYKEIMKKYNCVKPVWSTEIGLNAQGMTRQYIAGDMARKIATFFAAGGANVAWFGFLYPDPDAKIAGTGGDDFNMFDSRYCIYGPRIDAVMYYNLINNILIKKVIAERTWSNGVSACLFQDSLSESFAILWKDRGSADVVLPLPGVKEVRCMRIDGRRSTLDAGGKGIGLTIGEDPLLIAYHGKAALPDSLAAPVIRIVSAPQLLVRGVPATIELATAADPKLVTLIAPPAWNVARDKENPLRFTVASPEGSRARAGDILVRLANAKGGVNAELSCRPAVAGRLGVEIRPVPAAKAGGQPSAMVVISNQSAQSQSVNWSFAFVDEQEMIRGEFADPQPTSAYLADLGTGTLTVAANSKQTVLVPLAGIDPLKVYHAKATITDAGGGSISCIQPLAGFAGVARAKAVKMDGVLDEQEWAHATACGLNKADQFYGFDKLVWQGPSDLSATLRCLWDDKNLYIGVEVTDNVFANTKSDGELWAGDGLQFLFDPKRDQETKPGKYDAGFALGTKGPQAWYWLTASESVPSGLQKDITVAIKRGTKGNTIYEVAIPWSKLAPFEPAVGADLGACMIVNEDDGKGRLGFTGWFGNPHTKHVNTAGDMILLDK